MCSFEDQPVLVGGVGGGECECSWSKESSSSISVSRGHTGGTDEAREQESSREVFCKSGFLVAFGSGLVTLMLVPWSPAAFGKSGV